MSVGCASLAGGREIGPGLGLGDLFTEAELAVADHLVQLSGSGEGDETASGPESPRSVNTCAGVAAWEERAEVAGLGLGTMELDRRARKRCRLLSDVYAATRPVIGADAGNARKRKRGRRSATRRSVLLGSLAF
ncbi:uncharacterized protein [Zea mays]|jgi:hypothetical protein|uniref:Uncharacterized protein n=1 Tax=Zea mays TaxID=4577 RepID=A0A1D6IPQ9_MAIZE|nr:uncharacterized protein LOC103633616 [Zea mays]ONM61217.1 hypothetical protein ZEAMMB73_Zm00001d022605 [Zea mays]|eukprot:XP_008653559.1 uncharacterized protein LOC103633616 [Zea mays]